MFENKTFENILNDMLTYVQSKNPELDINTGSIIYTALAPIALELETAYHQMDMVLDETFVATASKEQLVKHGDQLGLEINYASCAQFIGEFNVDLEIGTRFNGSSTDGGDKFNYTVINKVSDPVEEGGYYIFELVCETPGSEPNGYLGQLKPITNVSGLNHAKLVKITVYGEDEEDTESYRYRLQTHAKNPPLDGNIAQYNEWLDAYDGIGKYRVLPLWNGDNTVKLTILNPDNGVADSSLIEQVQQHFDPPLDTINDDRAAENYPQGRGMGNGQAPIGAVITVDTMSEAKVEIACLLKLADGYTDPTGVQSAVKSYLNSIAFDGAIEYMPIYATIYAVESVAEIRNLTVCVTHKVDGQDQEHIMDSDAPEFLSRVLLDSNEIPALSDDCTWGVVNGAE